MAKPACDETTFVELMHERGSEETARILGVHVRNVHKRRANIEKRRGIVIVSPNNKFSTQRAEAASKHPHRLIESIHDGIVLVGSDSHYWPGVVTTAHRAFVKFAKTLKTKIIVKNGDELDFPSISRFSPGSWTNWEKQPKVADEIEATKERLHEIAMACPKAKRFWPLGNHDARFETRLATQAQEYANVHGIHLKDHFPEWEPCWSVWINDDVVIKHRFRGGIYAPRNNTLFAGRTLITGHLHSLKVWPHSDYNGTRFGVDTGTIAEPYGPQSVDYTEDSPVDWRSGFVVLYFHGGRLLWPQIAHVIGDGKIDFQGQVIEI